MSGASQSFARDHNRKGDGIESEVDFDGLDMIDQNRTISAHDVYDQLKAIRNELDRVRTAKKQMKLILNEQNIDQSIGEDSRYLQDEMDYDEE